MKDVDMHPMAIAMRESLESAAECDWRVMDAEHQMLAREAELELEAAANGKNDTERKAAAKDAIAKDPECDRLRALINTEKRCRAFALADAEGWKYSLRLTIATLGAGHE